MNIGKPGAFLTFMGFAHVNYYRFYPGDYSRDTYHLSWLEDLAYRRLLDHCYATEKNLPSDQHRLYRICRAEKKAERAAVDFVTLTFFNVTNGILTNNRVKKQLEQEQKRISVCRENGKHGGRPSNPTGNQNERPPSPSPSLRLTDPLKSRGSVVVRGSDDHHCPHQEIIELYHKILPMCPRIKKWHPQRAGYRALSQRWREEKDRQDLEWWGGYFGHVADSGFLTGKVPGKNGSRPFLANLEWLAKLGNMLKVYENHYDG